MRDRFRTMLSLLLTAGAAACQSATAPDTSLPLPGAPDLVAFVSRTAHESGPTPAGYVSQYAVWVAVPPSTAADAGVVVGASTPVFLSRHGVLARTTGASISIGDSIQVWHDASVAYGAVQAPPGAPCYTGTQVLILR